MAIAQRPGKKNGQHPAEDKAAAAFITGAGKLEAEEKKVQTTMHFDKDVLKRIDEAAKRRGISRSSFVQFVVTRALDNNEA